MADSSPRLDIVGSGIAAATCALLGAQQGFAVCFDSVGVPPERIVSVPRATVDLIEELTGVSIARTLPSRTVTTRRVAWESRDVSSMPIDALVFDAGALAREIGDHFLLHAGEAQHDHEPVHWTIVAQGRQPGAGRITAGERQAISGWIASLPGFDEAETVVACTPQAWVFAAPHPVAGIALTAVYPPWPGAIAVDHVLEEAIDFLWPGFGPRVERPTARGVLAAPSLEPGCAVPGRLAAGEAAIGFDPLRGDGVGNAVRGALLAQSVIAAIAGGADEASCLAHYSARLAHAFAEHVQTCSAHYSRAWNAAIWSGEVALMSACAARLTPSHPLGLRLEGRALVPA